MLKTRFIPVAIDQAYQRRQKDTEGDFYRKIAGQGPRNNFNGTTQGFYIATAWGRLLLYNNNRDPNKVAQLMLNSLVDFRKVGGPRTDAAAIDSTLVDQRYNPDPPEGGIVVRVQAKVLEGYEPPEDAWQAIFQSALSRDNLWISKSEHEALVSGKLPKSLQMRIARFHLVDNTRGEPPMWREEDVRSVGMTLANGKLTGKAHLETKDGQRGYDVELLGKVESNGGKVTRFDIVALGDFWGEGPYTRNAPEGKFPLAISFTLADGSDIADAVPPQGSRGWVPGYIK